MRNRREIGAIGFQHELVERCCCQRLADILAILKRDNAGEAHQRVQRDDSLHRRGVVRETMKHPPHAAGERRQERERIFESVALVDDAVQSGLSSHFKMLLEQRSLRCL